MTRMKGGNREAQLGLAVGEKPLAGEGVATWSLPDQPERFCCRSHRESASKWGDFLCNRTPTGGAS